MQASDAVNEFLRLVSGGVESDAPVDAISRELARPPRVSEVKSLRDAASVEAFRTAMIDALIENDAARQALVLVNNVLQRVLVAGV